MIVLTLNSGSSSLKFGLYRVEGTRLETLMSGEQDGDVIRAEDARGSPLVGTPVTADNPDATIGAIVSLLARAKLPVPDAIGHRIVHGGTKLRAHCLIDDGVERDLETAAVMSPLHAPAALKLIRLAKTVWPHMPQVACLDTAFHADMPALARTLPIAKELQAQGVRRYGFHGLSCESIVQHLGSALPARLIIAHLGSGTSVTAVREGRSIDTSMGLTPAGGVVMATRSGDLDPGVLIYLLREQGYDAAMLEDLIDRRSGLLGVSGLSGDMRRLHDAASSSPDARLAIAMFCLSAAKAIAGMILVLGGVDAIVFTGGIGEHDVAARATICRYLDGLGIRFDEGGVEATHNRVDAAGPRCCLHVLPAREDEQIATHTRDIIAART